MSVVPSSVTVMMIDCDTCTARGDACSDCVVTFLTIPVRHRAPVDLDVAEQDAIAVLAGSGLVPPLRLARAQ